MIAGVRQRLHERSVVLLLSLENALPRIMSWWLVLALLACAARVASSPLVAGAPGWSTILPYALLVVAPLVSMGLALRWFADGHTLAQPATRLARVGRWRTVGAAEAGAHRLYGPSGLMVSLLVGMLLNVPVRAAEYLAAMPALSGPVPHWLSVLHMMMTLDVVLLTSLYTVAFVAALRRVPLFPRLLVAIWAIDLAMQLGIAQAVSSAGGLPRSVGAMLLTVLDGNVKKVMVSVVLWAPYVLLSTRVNVTYRSRVPA